MTGYIFDKWPLCLDKMFQNILISIHSSVAKHIYNKAMHFWNISFWNLIKKYYVDSVRGLRWTYWVYTARVKYLPSLCKIEKKMLFVTEDANMYATTEYVLAKDKLL